MLWKKPEGIMKLFQSVQRQNMKDGKLGCGGLIVIIFLVFAFLNDFAEELGGALQLFMWIGVIIIIAAVVKFIHDN